MDLASLLMPMLSGGMGAQGSMAGMQPIQQPGTQTQQGQMAPYMNPDQMAQLQTDTLDYQRRNQLANVLMSQGYVPNSGKFGMLAGIASMLGGKLAQNANDAKLSDIIKRQYQADSEAAAAKRQQDLQDLSAKTQIETGGKIQEDEAKSKFEKQYQKNVVDNGFIIDPNNPNAAVAVPGMMQQQLALKKAEADIAASHAGAAESAKLGMIQKVMGMPDSPQKTAMLSSLVGEGGMQAIAFSGMGGGGGQGGAVGSAPQGEDFLKTLSPAIAAQVKAIGEYRQAPLTSMAMRSPMGAALMQAVNQAYPDYDATTYPTRSKARVDMTSGPGAKNVNAFNTAIEHAGQLLDSADALGNYGGLLTPLNAPKNAIASAFGAPAPKEFAQNREALAGELTKAFRGASGSEKDIEEMRNNINAAGSPEQLHAAVGKAMQLLASKGASLKEQYEQAMGSGAPNFFSPKAQAALAKLTKAGVDTGDLGADIGVAPTSQLSDADLLKKYGGG